MFVVKFGSSFLQSMSVDPESICCTTKHQKAKTFNTSEEPERWPGTWTIVYSSEDTTFTPYPLDSHGQPRIYDYEWDEIEQSEAFLYAI